MEPPIQTSLSDYSAALACPRRRYWLAEAPSGPSYAGVTDQNSAEKELAFVTRPQTRGWERKTLSLTLATASWCRKLAQGLLVNALGGSWDDLEDSAGVNLVRLPINSSEVISMTLAAYREEIQYRGFCVPPMPQEYVERAIAEQCALVESFGWAYLRIRIANIISEYHLLTQQKPVQLSKDVGWDAEHDALLKRKSDGKRFGYRVEISGNPDSRWRQSREIDHTLLVDDVDGVLIDGFDMGERVKLHPETLRESREHPQPWEGQRNRLVYGYKSKWPLYPAYSCESTTQKGWQKFAVWEENFAHIRANSQYQGVTGIPIIELSPVAYWVNWLPVEQVEEMFTSLTVLRNDKTVESMKRQIIAAERKIRWNRVTFEAWPTTEYVTGTHSSIDEHFPQNLRVCFYDKCQFFAMCHGDAASDPQKHGFIARREK